LFDKLIREIIDIKFTKKKDDENNNNNKNKINESEHKQSAERKIAFHKFFKKL